MRYSLNQLPTLLRSPLGRRTLAYHARSRMWPLLYGAAWLARRTWLRRRRIVAVVGSYGKTSTVAALRTCLGLPEPRRAKRWGLGGHAAALLRLRRGSGTAVLEVSINRRGQMARHARMIRPDVVVMTCIGSEHAKSLGSLEETLAEKARILDGLRPDGLVVLNGDDPLLRGLLPRIPCRVVTYGSDAANDVRAADARIDWPHGTRFRLHMADVQREVLIPLLGREMVLPALASIAVASAEGRTLDEALEGLGTLTPLPSRLQPLPLKCGVTLLRDEFKSSLETIDTALDVMAEIPARRIVVMGDISEPPGPQGPIYRRLGARIADIAEQAIIVGEHHRRFAAGATRAGMAREAIVDAGRCVHRAVELVRERMRPGDVVLIKGRNTQRLERIALALEGRTVGCRVPVCRAPVTRCEACPMLERGWNGQSPPF